MATTPTWSPTEQVKQTANVTHWMSRLNLPDVKSFHHWTVTHYQDFWQQITATLGIIFKTPYKNIVDLTNGVESPSWFKGATLNIADSCFQAPTADTAIIYVDRHQQQHAISYGDLEMLSNRIANSLVKQGFHPGDAIGIAMPMNDQAVAIYLGIIKMGGVVVSIADSFSADEMVTRLRIARAKAIFTQDVMYRGGKTLPLYQKVQQAAALLETLRIIVIPAQQEISVSLANDAITWQDFLVAQSDFVSVACDPMSPCNILFSSGTTGTPKAIPWNHTTPIKAASDAYFHQNIQPGDVLAWPTNLGWMMGPWLIFAAFINRATIALYCDVPKDKAFGEFVQNAKVTMLGVVPTLVVTWHQTKCMEGLNWQAIKVFSSTGECSNPEDMAYLMSLAGGRPVIEYCGGTEIGGAYVSSTVVEDNYPALFTTPTMGLDFTIIDEQGQRSDIGEVAIIPPAIGLSTTLINADHHHVYYEKMPRTSDGKPLRRHGDQIQQVSSGHYCVLGRVDDTMNLGGIKVSSAEIERCLVGIPDIIETAAIAIPPTNGGPSLLVIIAATNAALEKTAMIQTMQKKINAELNPLFKIHDVVFVTELPKTASNKIMRRVLRDRYHTRGQA